MTKKNTKQLFLVALSWLIIAFAVIVVNQNNSKQRVWAQPQTFSQFNSQNTPVFRPSPDTSEFINSFYQSANTLPAPDLHAPAQISLSDTTLDSWTYPKAQVVRIAKSALTMETSDGIDAVTQWYEENISRYSGFVEKLSGNNQAFTKLRSADENGYVSAIITKNADKTKTQINVTVIKLSNTLKSISI